MSAREVSRRGFIKIAVVGSATAPLAAGLLGQPAWANLPPLSPDDPTAKALGYVEDTATVDKAKYPNHTTEQKCNNCNLVQAIQADGRHPCAIFPGKSVSDIGWCATWVKKVG